ncbi:MAG TPA: GIY-YIG nuclease family protein [Candidatus Magasanikbacteria bacterium]|jgi:putative endonuclease|nr:GIY-YIG nuclease family protein [Candidatus Magasanikbacteria bacterium]
MEGSKYITYVLKDDYNKLYKGVTNNLVRRFNEHKKGKTKTTSRMKGLKVVYTEEFDSFKEARKREVYFKTAAGRRYLKNKLSEYSSVVTRPTE